MGNADWGHLLAQAARCVRSPGCMIAHVGLYLVAATVLVMANVIASPSELWFWQPLLVLGVVLALHIALIITAGHTARLRAAMAEIGQRWSDWRARLPGRTDAETPPAGSRPTSWPREPQSEPRPLPTGGSPIPMTVAAEPVSWPAASLYSSWPAARPGPPAPTAAAWPEGAPAWSASWPAPPVAGPRPAAGQVRSEGHDMVLDDGNGTGSGTPHPTWDQLEVAAASWLSQRAAEPAGETAP